MKKRTKFSVIYYICNFLIFGLTGYLLVSDFNSETYSFAAKFTNFSYGLALALLLLPLHEYIHVLAYKMNGAANTSYDANLRKFYFMALADKFVANKREFQIVALAPFLIISSILIGFIFIADQNWILTCVATLLAHTAMCSGDFGLLSYFDYHQDKDVVTYDEVGNNISCFYGRLKR
ncbi:MAG: DUF3267 domain-containing protein, partial [Daejeonella sp.]|nr:DUF3267 domain-containing protein [Daejeonella sp.]